MRNAQGYGATAATILLTVYGQLIVKWQVNRAGRFPSANSKRIEYLVKLTFNPWVLTAFLAALLAALAWFIVLSHFNLSSVYPFLSLTFVLTLFLSAPLFGEPITIPKVAGVFIVLGGLSVMVQ
jgi:drug/metabolite transporter (DMT)-like permease